MNRQKFDPRATFSFAELWAEPRSTIVQADSFTCSDGLTLAVYRYPSRGTARQSLVFIHGGGAYSGAGYQYLAESLSQKHQSDVWLLDIRGHGLSGGPRGAAPSAERVWQDVAEFIALIQKDAADRPIVLGGHSSGGGLVLNYASWPGRTPVSAYAFVSPKWGYRSGADRFRPHRDPFASPCFGNLALFALSAGRWRGNALGARMRYSEESKRSAPHLVETYSCTIVRAITPQDPKRQFAELDRPFCLAIGSEDELFDPEITRACAEAAPPGLLAQSPRSIIPGQKHMAILRVAGELIGAALDQVLSRQTPLR